MAITYFGEATKPADNSSNAESAGACAVTPPSSMVAGDLCIMIGHNRRNSDNLSVSETGGQSWTTINHSTSGAGQAAVVAWCRYNGSWTANPSIKGTSSSGTVPLSCQLFVFRPTTSSNVWAIDNTISRSDFSAPSDPFTMTVTGITTTQANTVAFAIWLIPDDPTVGSVSGSGWVATSTAQYRNTAGSIGMAESYAYKIQTSAGATGNVSKNESASNSYSTLIVSFYEASGSSNTIYSKQQSLLI